MQPASRCEFDPKTPWNRNRSPTADILRRVLNNISWLSAGSVFSAGQTLMIGVWMARHFGPERYGLYAFAMGVAQLLLPVAALGLPVIFTRELVRRRAKRTDSEGVLIGSVLALRLMGAGFAWAVVVGWAWWMYEGEPEKQVFLWLASAMLLPQTLWMLERWFVARMESRVAVWSRALVSVPAFLARVFLLVTDGPLIGFVWVAFAQSALEGVVLLLAYRWWGGRPGAWRTSWREIGYLGRCSWPLLISGLAAGLLARVDQVMLEIMHGNQAVAHYAIALLLIEGPNFIPVVVAMSLFPVLVDLRTVRPGAYRQDIQAFFDLMLWLGVGLALGVGILGPWGLAWLLGPAYVESRPLMPILSVCLVGFSLMVAMTNYLVAEGASYTVGMASGAACGLNILLNLWWIPSRGAQGAAWASGVSWLALVFVFPLLTLAGRQALGYVWRAWTAPWRWRGMFTSMRVVEE